MVNCEKKPPEIITYSATEPENWQDILTVIWYSAQ